MQFAGLFACKYKPTQSKLRLSQIEDMDFLLSIAYNNKLNPAFKELIDKA